MSSNERQSERKSDLISEVELPDGNTIRKWENTDGKMRYTRNGQFVSPDVGRGLEETTELSGPAQTPGGEMTQRELSEYGHGISSEDLRRNRIENKYGKWDDTEALRDDVILGGASNERNRWIQSWMGNETVERKIENDPLLETQGEKNRAREAYARDIVSQLEQVSSEGEAKDVLRQYDIY